MKKLMQTLFSITKNPNIKYKIISILGFKIKTINKQYVQKLEQEKLQLENDKLAIKNMSPIPYLEKMQ